jgi:hypothetical protein
MFLFGGMFPANKNRKLHLHKNDCFRCLFGFGSRHPIDTHTHLWTPCMTKIVKFSCYNLLAPFNPIKNNQETYMERPMCGVMDVLNPSKKKMLPAPPGVWRQLTELKIGSGGLSPTGAPLWVVAGMWCAGPETKISRLAQPRLGGPWPVRPAALPPAARVPRSTCAPQHVRPAALPPHSPSAPQHVRPTAPPPRSPSAPQPFRPGALPPLNPPTRSTCAPQHMRSAARAPLNSSAQQPVCPAALRPAARPPRNSPASQHVRLAAHPPRSTGAPQLVRLAARAPRSTFAPQHVQF